MRNIANTVGRSCEGVRMMNQLILAYYVRINGEIVIGEELAEIKAIPPEKLRPWKFGTGPAVSDWLAKRKG